MTTDPKSRTAAPPPTLAEVQELLQLAMLKGDDRILVRIMDNSRTSRTTLLGVYQNGYASRLVDILASEYPLLQRYVGDEAFDGFAREFIAAHPSRTQNARWFGVAFPEFLEKHVTASEHPEYAEITAIEKAASDAFDSADAPVLGFADLAAVPPDKWAQLAFSPHPSATVLSLATNAFALWRALKDEEGPPDARRLEKPQRLAAWRQGVSPKLRAMADEEAMMWTEASRGVRFEVLCEMLATFDDPESAAVRAAGYLQGWLASEMLTSVKLVKKQKFRAAVARN